MNLVFEAVKNNDLHLVSQLIDLGFDINIINDEMITPLIYADRRGYYDMVKLLRKNGAKYFHSKTLRKMYQKMIIDKELNYDEKTS